MGTQVVRTGLGLCENEVAFPVSVIFAASGDYAMMER